MRERDPKDPTLRNIRQNANINMVELARRMGITSPANISLKELDGKFEYLTINFLRKYIEACGGRVTIVIDVNGERILK